jgi:hypothetical protein
MGGARNLLPALPLPQAPRARAFIPWRGLCIDPRVVHRVVHKRPRRRQYWLWWPVATHWRHGNYAWLVVASLHNVVIVLLGYCAVAVLVGRLFSR